MTCITLSHVGTSMRDRRAVAEDRPHVGEAVEPAELTADGPGQASYAAASAFSKSTGAMAGTALRDDRVGRRFPVS
ncbi:MAG: hypothetical protein IPJ97_17925 [Proteobacteria bacterium]|nr:hypothetical protein [Pseudomonadota bacterium]